MDLNQTEQNILTDPPIGSHIVKIASDDKDANNDILLNSIIHYIRIGLQNAESIIVIAKPIIRRAIISRLDRMNLDFQSLRNKGQIKFFDTEFLLSSFIIDNKFQKIDFQECVKATIQAHRSNYQKKRVFSDMVNVLGKKDSYQLAIEVEDSWNNILAKYKFSLLCFCFINIYHGNTDYLERICNYHTHIIK